MTKYLFLSLFFIFNIFNFKDLNAIENKILFKIDNQIITSLDIKKEIKYLKAVNQKINSLDKNQVLEIAKNSLIKEKLKEIKVSTFVKEIKLEEIYLENLIKNIERSNNLKNTEELKKYLIKNDVKYEYMIKKLSIETLWNKFIFDNFSPKVKINKKLIEKQVKNNKNYITQYNLSEIVFDISESENEKEKSLQIKKNIENFGFEKTALTFSISASANQGGKIGWISENSLNKKLSNEINKLKLGEFTNPIVIPGGFIIIKLDKIKKEEKKIDVDKEIEKIIRFKTNEQLNTFSNIYLKKIMKDHNIENI